MSALDKIVTANKPQTPLDGKTILVCTHATAATAKLIRAATALGANVVFVPVSYNNNTNVANYLKDTTNVVIMEATETVIRKVLPKIDILFEDGMRISELVYKNPSKYKWKKHMYSIEQTTSGIREFERVSKSGLLYPVINLAESETNLEIENAAATPESIISLLVTGESFSFARKTVLVIGYGAVGRGMSRFCKLHGSVVTVVESDPVRRAVATTQGYATVNTRDIDTVMGNQDIVISCTHNSSGSCLGLEQIMLMKDGSIIVNAGSGRGEITLDALTPGTYEANRAVVSVTKNNGCITCSFEKMNMTKSIKILCSAAPLNLGCSNGTSDEIMDIVFSVALVTMIRIDGRSIPCDICMVDRDVERQVATTWLPDKYDKMPCHINEKDLVREIRPWGNLFRFVPNNGAASLERFSTVRASFEPGTNTDGHYHAVSEEAYLVESGVADILVWDPNDLDRNHKTYHMKTGDYLSIPRGQAHRVFVDSVEKFVCVIVASPSFSFWDQFFPVNPPGSGKF